MTIKNGDTPAMTITNEQAKDAILAELERTK